MCQEMEKYQRDEETQTEDGMCLFSCSPEERANTLGTREKTAEGFVGLKHEWMEAAPSLTPEQPKLGSQTPDSEIVD